MRKLRKLFLFAVERTKTILHVWFHIVTSLFWEPWRSVEIWNLGNFPGNFVATSLGTLQIKHHINISSVDSVSLKLTFGVLVITIEFTVVWSLQIFTTFHVFHKF